MKRKKRNRNRNFSPIEKQLIGLATQGVGFLLNNVVGPMLRDLISQRSESPVYELAQMHPEALEMVRTRFNERQEGRSEVIGEMARPKPN
jgi:hypothetical protein